MSKKEEEDLSDDVLKVFASVEHIYKPSNPIHHPVIHVSRLVMDCSSECWWMATTEHFSIKFYIQMDNNWKEFITFGHFVVCPLNWPKVFITLHFMIDLGWHNCDSHLHSSGSSLTRRITFNPQHSRVSRHSKKFDDISKNKNFTSREHLQIIDRLDIDRQ